MQYELPARNGIYTESNARSLNKLQKYYLLTIKCQSSPSLSEFSTTQ